MPESECDGVTSSTLQVHLQYFSIHFLEIAVHCPPQERAMFDLWYIFPSDSRAQGLATHWGGNQEIWKALVNLPVGTVEVFGGGLGYGV